MVSASLKFHFSNGTHRAPHMEAVHGSFWPGNLRSKRPNGLFHAYGCPLFEILEQALIAIRKAQKTTEHIYIKLPILKCVRLRLIAAWGKTFRLWMLKLVVSRK